MAAGAKVVLGGEGGGSGRKVSDGAGGSGAEAEGEETVVWPDEEHEEEYDEDEPAFSGGAFTGSAGWTAADEKWAAEQPEEAGEREDYESLMRYLQQRKEPRAPSGGS